MEIGLIAIISIASSVQACVNYVSILESTLCIGFSRCSGRTMLYRSSETIWQAELTFIHNC